MSEEIESQVSVNKETLFIDDINVTKYNYDFNNLLSINPNTIGWINISNTNINYPIVKYSDNSFYLTHSFDNSKNSAGWIFADFQNLCDGTDKNIVIYGHNRRDKSMFGSLKNVLDSNWYSNDENLYINFASLNECHIYKIFSAFVCCEKEISSYIQKSFFSDEEFQEYIEKLKKASTHNFNTNLKSSDKIITLYTCYGLNNQRLIVCAKLIE